MRLTGPEPYIPVGTGNPSRAGLPAQIIEESATGPADLMRPLTVCDRPSALTRRAKPPFGTPLPTGRVALEPDLMVVMDCVLELAARVCLAAGVTVLLTCPSAQWL